MNAAEKALRNVRMLHAGFFLACIAYILVPLVMIKTPTKEVNPIIAGMIFFFAVSDLGIATFFRARLVSPVAKTLAQNPEDTKAAAKWSRGVSLSLVFCMATVLFGVALQILGATWNVYGLFFVTGILLLLAWRPKLDLPSSTRS
jgi:hypothetical protein